MSVSADDHTASNSGTVTGSLQWNSSSAVSSTRDLEASGFELAELAPNPVTQDTRISYTLPEAENIRISLFDIQGKLVKSLYNGRQASGLHQLPLAVDDLPSGQYYLSLIARGGVITKKVVVAK